MSKRFAKFTGTEATQMADELGSFIKLLQDRQAKSYLEIGARCGDSFDAIMRALPPGSMGVAIDLPDSGWGESESAKKLSKVCFDLHRDGYDARMLLGSSRDEQIIETVEKLISGGLFDAILIDGDHSYQGVLADHFNYFEMGKLVAYHDIVWQPDGNTPIEVPRLWQELKADCDAEPTKPVMHEIVATGSTMGIGVIIRE